MVMAMMPTETETTQMETRAMARTKWTTIPRWTREHDAPSRLKQPKFEFTYIKLYLPSFKSS
jgi:hypothetical protein